MMTLDTEATFLKLEKLRERMTRLEKNPDEKEWQYTRLLIRALAEGISKTKRCPTEVSRKVQRDAPEAVRGDWQELVDVLRKKGIQAAGTARATRRKA